MQNLKNDTNELIYKAETDSQTYRMDLCCQGEEWEEGIVREFGINIYTLLYLKWITNKVLLYTQGTLLSFMWQPGCEGLGGEWICVYVRLSPSAFPPETITTLYC